VDTHPSSASRSLSDASAQPRSWWRTDHGTAPSCNNYFIACSSSDIKPDWTLGETSYPASIEGAKTPREGSRKGDFCGRKTQTVGHSVHDFQRHVIEAAFRYTFPSLCHRSQAFSKHAAASSLDVTLRDTRSDGARVPPPITQKLIRLGTAAVITSEVASQARWMQSESQASANGAGEELEAEPRPSGRSSAACHLDQLCQLDQGSPCPAKRRARSSSKPVQTSDKLSRTTRPRDAGEAKCTEQCAADLILLVSLGTFPSL
jgi:hypothetical protein